LCFDAIDAVESKGHLLARGIDDGKTIAIGPISFSVLAVFHFGENSFGTLSGKHCDKDTGQDDQQTVRHGVEKRAERA
jgi:hypothetical protein